MLNLCKVLEKSKKLLQHFQIQIDFYLLTKYKLNIINKSNYVKIRKRVWKIS